MGLFSKKKISKDQEVSKEGRKLSKQTNNLYSAGINKLIRTCNSPGAHMGHTYKHK